MLPGGLIQEKSDADSCRSIQRDRTKRSLYHQNGKVEYAEERVFIIINMRNVGLGV